MTTLGERIAQARREKAVRERRDVTMREVANAVGVTGTSMSEWESDKVIPREDALAKLAAFLNVTPAYLRYGVVSADGTPELVQNENAPAEEAGALERVMDRIVPVAESREEDEVEVARLVAKRAAAKKAAGKRAGGGKRRA